MTNDSLLKDWHFGTGYTAGQEAATRKLLERIAQLEQENQALRDVAAAARAYVWAEADHPDLPVLYLALDNALKAVYPTLAIDA